MGMIISSSIDLTKIDKTKIKPHANGSKYYDLSIFIKDEPDQYQHNVAIANGQTKEEREAKEKKVYIGNGKIVWQSAPSVPDPAQTQTNDPQPEYKQPYEKDDLPF